MIRRAGLVVLSFLCLLVAAAPPSARREPQPQPQPQREPRPRPFLVITEIMYDPQSGETDEVQTEWVEIHNRGAQPISLRGLQITSGTKGKVHDAKQRFVLGGVTIGANEYAIIGIGAASCYAEFKLPPLAVNCGETKYAWLTNTGDSVAIRDEKSNILDEVVYGVESPWPAATRGGGGSIQFVPPPGEDPTVANDKPENWVASVGGNSDEFENHGRGTPGGPPKEGGTATTQPARKR